MSRYSKVARRFFADEKVRRLSAPQPNGQSLFLWLLITDKLDCIPGLIPIGEAGAAEALRWPLKGFREAFAEVFREGLAEADWEAQLIWVPNAIRHNKPESPNVIRAWRYAWERMPECSLKRKAYQTLKGFVEALGEGFTKAFQEGLGEDYAESRSLISEQEQEQDSSLGVAPPVLANSESPKKRSCQIPEGFAPNAGHRSLALELGVSLEAELPKFIDFHTAKGSTMKSWDAALRTWLRKAQQFGGRSNGAGTDLKARQQRVLAEIMAEES